MSTFRDRKISSEEDSVRRYGLGLLGAAAALGVRQLLTPLMGEANPYHTVWAAVAFASWYCGLGPSILATLVSLIGVWYWFLPPARSFQLSNPRSDVFGMIGFLFFSALIVALGESNRRSLARRERAEQLLQQAHDDLERRVAERTADLNAANESLRELSGRLQQLRDEEHRQIARELHDSVGQLLAAVGLNLGIVQRQANRLDTVASRALTDNAAIVEQINREIRTISHLLHPPLLDAAGLASALRWYVDGFTERSKIKVDLQIPDEFGRLSEEMEIAIFRMIQECLTNVHRHSGGERASISVREEGHRIWIEVRDEGKGIPLEKRKDAISLTRGGVGFRGMRERFGQLGGTVDIQSGESGTVVVAMLPLTDTASKVS